MKFVLLIYQGTTPLPGSDGWNALSEEEQRSIYRDYAQLNETRGVTPGVPLALPGAAATVRVRNGKAEVTTGPHLAEGLGGYLEFEAENIEAAIALAAKIPAARLGGVVEVRPSAQW